VENSWPCMTGGPSGRDDLSKSRRDLLRGPAEHAVTCRTSGSLPRDEETRAADQDGAARQRGSDERRDYLKIDRTMELRSGMQLRRKGAVGPRRSLLRPHAATMPPADRRTRSQSSTCLECDYLVDKLARSCFVLGWRVEATREMSSRENLLKTDGRAFRVVDGGCL
jgi:hypothetical protein